MKNSVIFVLLAFVLSGCAPLVIGAGGAASYVAVQDRGFQEAGRDIALKTILLERITRMNEAYIKDLSISVRRGEAFITGVVENEGQIQAIQQRAKSVKGVRRVINAIQLKPYPFKQYMKDILTAGNLRSRLLVSKDVYTANYEMNIVKGEVYLFGWAYTQEQIDTTVHVARTTKGIEKVHNYLRVMENGRQKLQKIKRQRKEAYDKSFGVDQVK